MNLIDTCTNTLAAAICQGSIYKDYRKALIQLEGMPEIKRQVDELRALNYKMQNENDSDSLYADIDEIEKNYEVLLRIPEVTAFLEKELDLCKQLKNMNIAIYQELNIDVPNL